VLQRHKDLSSVASTDARNRVLCALKRTSTQSVLLEPHSSFKKTQTCTSHVAVHWRSRDQKGRGNQSCVKIMDDCCVVNRISGVCRFLECTSPSANNEMSWRHRPSQETRWHSFCPRRTAKLGGRKFVFLIRKSKYHSEDLR
jgi:hypothetical protein